MNEQVQLVQRALAAVQRQAWNEAAELCNTVLSRFGADANALLLLGRIRMELGDPAGAIPLYERARAVMPTHVHVLVNLGAAYRRVGRLREARTAVEAALRVEPGFAVAHNNLGNIFLEMGEREDARREFERAVALDANYAEPAAGLAVLAEETHQLEEARRLSERALRLAPGNVSAMLTHARVQLREDRPADAALELAALLRQPALSSTNRVVAEGHLGEACDRQGLFEEAFAAYSRANSLQFAQHAAKLSQDKGSLSPHVVARLTDFISGCDPSSWSKAPPARDKAPVFLVGFPRSGTTLLDQILASHPQITTLEERFALVDACDALINQDDAFRKWGALQPGDFGQLQAAYRAQVSAGLRGIQPRPVFVDKLPLNAVLLPLIHRLFPTARIVLALRDPRDVVLSCFQQQFGMNVAMFQMLKLDTAVAYYDRVMNLVRLSREKFPLHVHELRYEDLIGDFDGTVRPLLTFLGLEWNDAVREYATTAKQRRIATPSASRVVLPIYASARGKWRNYRRFLEPYLPALEPWVRRHGYEPTPSP